MDTGWESARIRYVEERPAYEDLASRTAHELRLLAVKERLGCSVTYRAKDVSSFVKKIIRSDYRDPWNEIHDKAGVRLIVRHSDDLDRAAQMISENLFPIWFVDDREDPDFERKLSYPRLHFEVEASKLPPTAGFRLDDKRTCEIQVRTAAADLWSGMSHKLLYKNADDLPKHVRRALYGLLALVEVYDREVARAMVELASLPDHYLTSVLDHAESLFYTFCASNYDPTLSREILPVILAGAISDRWEDYADSLTTFVEQERPRIEEIFAHYGPATEAAQNGSFVLVGQPESIVVFHQLSVNPMRLADSWTMNLPEELLWEMRSLG